MKPYEGVMPQICLEPGKCKLVGIERTAGEELSLKYQLIVTPVKSVVKFV